MTDNARALYDVLMDIIKDNKDHRWDADIKQSLDMLESLCGMAGEGHDTDYDLAVKMARQALSET